MAKKRKGILIKEEIGFEPKKIKGDKDGKKEKKK